LERRKNVQTEGIAEAEGRRKKKTPKRRLIRLERAGSPSLSPASSGVERRGDAKKREEQEQKMTKKNHGREEKRKYANQRSRGDACRVPRTFLCDSESSSQKGRG